MKKSFLSYKLCLQTCQQNLPLISLASIMPLEDPISIGFGNQFGLLCSLWDWFWLIFKRNTLFWIIWNIPFWQRSGEVKYAWNWVLKYCYCILQIEVKSTLEQPFPSVTVCPLNMIHCDSLYDLAQPCLHDADDPDCGGEKRKEIFCDLIFYSGCLTRFQIMDENKTQFLNSACPTERPKSYQIKELMKAFEVISKFNDLFHVLVIQSNLFSVKPSPNFIPRTVPKRTHCNRSFPWEVDQEL